MTFNRIRKITYLVQQCVESRMNSNHMTEHLFIILPCRRIVLFHQFLRRMMPASLYLTDLITPALIICYRFQGESNMSSDNDLKNLYDLNLERSRYSLMLHITNDIFFEYNCVEDILFLFNSSKKKIKKKMKNIFLMEELKN